MIPFLTSIVQLLTAIISFILLIEVNRQKKKDSKRSQRKKSRR